MQLLAVLWVDVMLWMAFFFPRQHLLLTHIMLAKQKCFLSFACDWNKTVWNKTKGNEIQEKYDNKSPLDNLLVLLHCFSI